MTLAPQLCLGTVQFGLPYGITNHAGQVNEAEVHQILRLAASSGIKLFDTAQAYGSAEEVLGRSWQADAPRNLISKLPPGAPQETWEISFKTSLQRLQTSKLDAFLLHRASDLLSPDGEALLNWLKSLRDRGLVGRIGVSIYEAFELDGLPMDHLQLVQLPLSVYDQRLIRDGTLATLHERGIAVHVRSVLLQGLLLQSLQQWPLHLSPMFFEHHSRWLEYIHQKGLSQLAGALGFVRALEIVEAIVFGVVTVNELAQFLQAWNHLEAYPMQDQLNWAWDNVKDLDPRHWPTR